ncbi:MAG TPA: hypothetical protein VNW97_20570, partial [Candidatus Saccharimonadales bacterium]|nr:hypothetical protein [Candidatus Saccharimonadales bacterium]
YEARNLMLQAGRRENTVLESIVAFCMANPYQAADGSKSLTEDVTRWNALLDAAAKARGVKGDAPVSPWAGDALAARVPVRIGEFGPLTYQNDNVLLERLGAERYGKIKLLNSEATPLFNVQDQSELYAYEIVNFVDGTRTVGQIRDAVAAEYGPLSLDLVADYLNACVEARIMSWK